jgi:hypothetical protein
MTAESEMRAVIEHAAEKLAAAKDSKVICSTGHASHIQQNYYLPKDALLAIGYAEGILRLLASYLKVDAQSNGQPRGGGKPSDWPRDEHGRYQKAGAP